MKYWINVYSKNAPFCQPFTIDSRQEALKDLAQSLKNIKDVGSDCKYLHTIVYNSDGVVPISTQNLLAEACNVKIARENV